MDLALFTRRAGAATRRRTALKALGLAGFAAAAIPLRATAGKRGKKTRKRCRRQVAPCRDGLADLCEGIGCDFDAVSPCCESLGSCNSAEFFACLDDAIEL